VTLAPNRLGIVAGGGELPLRIADACIARAHPCFVLAVDEFALPVPARIPSARNPIGKLGRAFATLRRNACRDVVFAGKFERPVGPIRFNPDLTAAWLFVRRMNPFRRSDDSLHRIMAAEFERAGFRVVSPLDADPLLAAPLGYLTTTQAREQGDLARALRLAKDHGRSDEGQAVVVRDGAVVARESRAGTDAMLSDLARAGNRGGVLAKAMKPEQIRYVDPPAIGESTITKAAEAGLDGIVVEAGATVIVDKDTVAAAADRLGLFIFGAEAAVA
jgi:DUF1009 family protein